MFKNEGQVVEIPEPKQTARHVLVDSFSRPHNYLRISLSEACNLRCSYCMPSEIMGAADRKKMNADEIVRMAAAFIDLGVTKIRLTGGEPLIRKDAKEIIAGLAALVEQNQAPVRMAITTNGVFVHHFIDDFKRAGIRSVNVSLDSLMPDRFEAITKRNYFHQVVSNIHLLLQHGFTVKVNAVVMKGVNDDELIDFVKWTRDFPLQVRFIEFMPFTGNHWQKEKVFSYSEMLKRIIDSFEIIPLQQQPHDTAKHYKVLGFEGSFAFITTMSTPFCSSCNRLRLTADGKMKNCLFGKDETDLLTPLRAGEDISQLIIQNLMGKHAMLGGQFTPENLPSENHIIENRSMVAIGG